MDKIIYTFAIPENVILEIGDNKLTVKPYLSLKEQLQLISDYIDTYFFSKEKKLDKADWDYLSAEYGLRFSIMEICFLDMDVTASNCENMLYDAPVWSMIESTIKNYWDFRTLLNHCVEDMKSQIHSKESVGAVIDSLAGRLTILINQFIESTKSLTPEMLEELKKAGRELIEDVEKNPIAMAAYRESDKRNAK